MCYRQIGQDVIDRKTGQFHEQIIIVRPSLCGKWTCLKTSSFTIMDDTWPTHQGQFLGKHGGGTPGPIQNSTPVPPNEVHHVDILTEIYAIASLGLQAVPHLLAWPLHGPLHSGILKTTPAIHVVEVIVTYVLCVFQTTTISNVIIT